jgi:UDP-N-acetylmuramoylalanine-D-glutamate ligase
MTTLVIILNKIVTFLINILKIILHKDGSVWPGYIASKCDPDILNKLVYPKFVIGVTGSSGKGSTTKLIAKILTRMDIKLYGIKMVQILLML